MRFFFKLLLNLTVLVCFLVFSFVFIVNSYLTSSYKTTNVIPVKFKDDFESVSASLTSSYLSEMEENNKLDLWCIFTKVKTYNEPLTVKLKKFMLSLLISNNTHRLHLHTVCDDNSKIIAQSVLDDVFKISGKFIKVDYYNATEISDKIQDIVESMRPHFSSQPNSYYGDSLFFISLGLHLIAPKNMTRAAMFDVDTGFRSDIVKLFDEFQRFGSQALFGLAPELTPVYRHILYRYRNMHNNTNFGKSLSEGGYPGLNSGVILFRFDRIRDSELYSTLLEKNSTDFLAKKYSFKGHLGDQDFYTILGMEYPELIQILPCGWNRQLCDWWKNHGYKDIFAQFASCNTTTHLYHGNCNTAIPEL